MANRNQQEADFLSLSTLPNVAALGLNRGKFERQQRAALEKRKQKQLERELAAKVDAALLEQKIDAGKWVNLGNGILHNPQTGQTQNVEEFQKIEANKAKNKPKTKPMAVGKYGYLNEEGEHVMPQAVIDLQQQDAINKQRAQQQKANTMPASAKQKMAGLRAMNKDIQEVITLLESDAGKGTKSPVMDSITESIRDAGYTSVGNIIEGFTKTKPQQKTMNKMRTVINKIRNNLYGANLTAAEIKLATSAFADASGIDNAQSVLRMMTMLDANNSSIEALANEWGGQEPKQYQSPQDIGQPQGFDQNARKRRIAELEAQLNQK